MLVFTLNFIHSVHFDICIMNYIHHHSISCRIVLLPQKSIMLHLFTPPSLFQILGNHTCFYCFHSFAFSRMSYSQNHIICLDVPQLIYALLKVRKCVSTISLLYIQQYWLLPGVGIYE